MGERWNKQHAGIDIAASGTVPVVAAADGVVSRSLKEMQRKFMKKKEQADMQ